MLRFLTQAFLKMMFIALIIFLSCSSPTQYQKAKGLYENSLKEYGESFYRMPEYKNVLEELAKIPSSDPEYAKSNELLTKIQDERREARSRNVLNLLEKSKTEKPYSEMSKSNDPLSTPIK